MDEILESLAKQTVKDFEVMVVEDGSHACCTAEVDKFKSELDIKYYYKENSGPGRSRNYGFERAEGNYAVFLDSDCIVPENYVETVLKHLSLDYVDAFGGPDKADESFTRLQKAINYSMTSFFTTGGIRGGGEAMDKFYPRSFNMGYSREVFKATGGFSSMRFGEDIDMSIRIFEKGYKAKLFKDAYVFHKRRTSYRQFFKQVFNSGVARIHLHKRHPGTMKLVHTLPAFFTWGCVALIALAISWDVLFVAPILFYALLVFVDSSIKNKSMAVGLSAVPASFIQLCAYGLGFTFSFWKRMVIGMDEFNSFEKNFYQ